MHKFMNIFSTLHVQLSLVTMLILRMCHLNAEQLALCMLLLNLYHGKLTTHSNLKYTYTC